VYADKPFSTLALWGKILAGIGQRCDGRIVHASMTLQMLAETGEQATASEGFIDLLGSTKLADVTVLFKEAEPAVTRVSVRTSARADAVAITSAFGGGGHARAAGCTVRLPLAEAREQVLAECIRELERSDQRERDDARGDAGSR
jgi:phosphoesterase RecJ-like protein